MKIEEFYGHFLKHRKICTDSRKIAEGSIFFALKGENFNGNDFAVEAVNRGCVLAVVDEDQGSGDKRIIKVNNVLSFLQELANYHRLQFKKPVLAITGTNGKTTTKELISTVLSCQYQVVATKGNLNNHIGVPLSLLEIKEDTEIAVIEMGANHVGEIARLCEIAMPTHGLITNIGNAHLEGFGSPEMVKKAKNELYEYLREKKGVAFINIDDSTLTQLVAGIYIKSYGMSPEAEIQGKPGGDIFSGLHWKERQEANEWSEIRTRLIGRYNFHNILASISIGRYFGVERECIKNSLANYEPGINRSQFVETNKNRVILDAYNANPDSVGAAIRNFRELGFEGKMVILGDMFELGDYSEKAHADILNEILNPAFCEIILAGSEFFKVAQKRVQAFLEVEQLIIFLKNNPPENRTILIKGSRGMRMERLLDFL